MDRRAVVAGGLAALAVRPAFAQGAGAPETVIRLWPGAAPGGEGLSLPPVRITNREPPLVTPDRNVDQIGVPDLTLFRPAAPDGSAMIIAPGGSYIREVYDFEGADIARRFNQAGVTCFVLRYRLPGEGWARRSDVPLQDGQRAMRLVRANAATYGLDPERIGFMGFSAGGHLAASIATRFAANVYAPIDAADRVSARPSFSIPMYPVITMGEGAHAGSRTQLLGPDPTAALIDAYSIEKHVPADTPPTFIALAADDATVSAAPNGIAYYQALLGAKIPAELHVFEAGGHGFGLARTVGKPTAAWPELLQRWAKSHGYFKG